MKVQKRLIAAIALLTSLTVSAPAQAHGNDGEYDRLMAEGTAARERLDFDSALINFKLAQEAADHVGDDYPDNRACAKGAATSHFYAATAAKAVFKDPANQREMPQRQFLGNLKPLEDFGPENSFVNDIYVFTLRGALDYTLEDLDCF